MRRHVLFLLSPRAGRGRAADRLRRVLTRTPPLARRLETVEVRSVAGARDALARLEPGGVPVAVGGDGMVGLVAAALRECGMGDAALAILPFGTGNILARTLGLDDLGRAVLALREGAPSRVDVMRTSHPSAPVAVVSISGGFEGRFLMRYGGLRRFGRPLGALAALAESWGRADSVALELDGEPVLGREERAFSAGLYNTRMYAGGVVMSPDADPADGVGESVVYRSASAYWTTVARRLRGGPARARSGVIRRRWRRARLESSGPLQIDGEARAAGAISVWMEPAALPVLVAPRPAAAP